MVRFSCILAALYFVFSVANVFSSNCIDGHDTNRSYNFSFCIPFLIIYTYMLSHDLHYLVSSTWGATYISSSIPITILVYHSEPHPHVLSMIYHYWYNNLPPLSLPSWTISCLYYSLTNDSKWHMGQLLTWIPLGGGNPWWYVSITIL